jgi:hypothetical protein
MKQSMLILTTLTMLLSACASNSNAPSTVAIVSGNWTGTFAGTQASGAVFTMPFVMSLYQSGSTVIGTWEVTSGFAVGTVTGATTASSFAGTFTWNGRTGSGLPCAGTFGVSGAVGGDALSWTSPGVTADCTNLPTSITMTAQHP